MSRIVERFVDVGRLRVFVRETEGLGPPTVFVHGNPTHSADWLPFLERTRGPALAFDLPCFGRSERPPPEAFDPSMHGYANFVESLLDRLGVDRYRLVVHDWGVVGLLAAMRAPARVERLVLINALPLLPGFRWHWLARVWRRRGAGEVANAVATKAAVRLLLRRSRPRSRPMPSAFVEELWSCWDRGMARAMLRLYRSADPGALAAAGGGLGELRCPAVVVWGLHDPYVPPRFARAYAERFPNAEVVEVRGAGHWPWIDRPELVGLVADFLDGRGGGAIAEPPRGKSVDNPLIAR